MTTNNTIQPTQKTQISHLRRGHGRLGIVGSSYEERRKTARKVLNENPEVLTILYKGRKYELKYKKDASSFYYGTEPLSPEEVREFTPYDKRAIEHPELVHLRLEIDEIMRAYVWTSRRKSTGSVWKPGKTHEIAERDITII